jgi:hypothetical protein
VERDIIFQRHGSNGKKSLLMCAHFTRYVRAWFDRMASAQPASSMIVSSLGD